MANNSKMVLV